MLDKLREKLFPCSELLRQVREDHRVAVCNNASAHEDLKRVCINATYPQFAHVQGKNVNPR